MVEQLKKSISFMIIGISLGKVASDIDIDIVSQKAVTNFLKDIHKSSGNIPYDDLTAVVYNDVTLFKRSLKNDEFQEFINDYKKKVQDNKSLKDDEKKAYEKYLNKINRQVSLAIIQRGFIENISLDAEAKIAELEDKVKNATKKMKDSEGELVQAKKDLVLAEEKLNETKGSMYTEFIAILGIFSALIFGLFGSFDAVSSALTKISENSSISEVIVFSCIIIVPLLILIYGLLYWVGKLANKKLKSCSCEDENCNCSLYNKHKTFFIMLNLIGIVGVLGLMGMLLDLLPIKSEFGMFLQIFILFIILLNLIKFVYNSIFDKEFQWKKWFRKQSKSVWILIICLVVIFIYYTGIYNLLLNKIS